MAVSAFQLHNSNRDGVPSDMKCKRPKHGLTPFRVAWPTACRFTQRPCGQYNSAGRICQISRPSCHCEGAPRPWQSVLFCASGGVLFLGFCRGGALPRLFFTIPPSARSADTSATLRRTTQCEHWAAFTQGRQVGYNPKCNTLKTRRQYALESVECSCNTNPTQR